ncbi:type I secretion protein [Ruegeria sediminis]|uniref:Type I secretion protein n=1 Tax=Ruegeria sediminis TaxID=2583820 RepID=A0ABY2X117_9RHOB|nr:type I secretion protein [Ruegeria sediminis]TMV08919.1 type I secretion protein [Ruegeria sediminis]
MALDSISEQIAHFIGVFDLTIEQARLRDQYEEFTALRRQAEIDGLDDPIRIKVHVDLEPDPGNYKPLDYKFKELPPSEIAPPDLGPGIIEGPVETQNGGSDAPAPQDVLLAGNDAAARLIMMAENPEPDNEYQGSAVTFTAQYIYMSDNDTLGTGDFRDTGEMIAKAEALFNHAEAMHALAVPGWSIESFLSVSNVEAIAEAMKAEYSSDIEGLVVHRFHGEDAVGIIVNGEYVEEMPTWDDLLPHYHKPAEEEEDADGLTEKDLPAEWDRSKDEEFEDGHTVIVGGNLAINEANIQIGWVDAPYIALGGKSISLTMISQVAIVSDRDQGGQGGKGSGTDVYQVSNIETVSNPATWIPSDEDDATDQPSFLTVDWIQGDLVVTNFIKQIIDATDIDHISTEISASSSYFALGDNDLFNSNTILQLGSYYDLILIGGNMISIDMIFQTLALMDDDVLSGMGSYGGAADASDNNLLMNQASVKTMGQDTHDVPSANLTDALSYQKMDNEALEQALLSDPMFAGMEQMRVLKIDGSLLQVNIVEQITKLSDQDDVHLLGGGANAAAVVAGSNAMLNSASITKLGVDSVVMANSEEYSDLLLHQASLMDTPEDEAGGDELVNEAIAFLMEDGQLPDAAQNGSGLQGYGPEDLDQSTTVDGMQSMLA